MFLDTGGLLAAGVATDPLHKPALQILHETEELLVVTEYVLLETLNSLSRVRYRQRGYEILDLLAASGCETIAASPELWRAGLRLHRERADKEWSLTDCISFVVMSERGIIDALAHDHHFTQAGFRPLLRDVA
jgi:predicted nucleic acid-binding protein